MLKHDMVNDDTAFYYK